MRGRRPGKTGGVFAGIHWGLFRAEHDADGRGSFAVVERSRSLGRKLGEKTWGKYIMGVISPIIEIDRVVRAIACE
jgi:hypothetical protein